MSEEKVANFETGQAWTSDDKPYDELVAILGKPLADEIASRRGLGIYKKDPEVFIVTNVDVKNGIVTLKCPHSK